MLPSATMKADTQPIIKALFYYFFFFFFGKKLPVYVILNFRSPKLRILDVKRLAIKPPDLAMLVFTSGTVRF